MAMMDDHEELLESLLIWSDTPSRK